MRLSRLFLGVLAIAASGSVFGNTITVTGAGDVTANDGVCTLREAITAANTNTAANGCGAGAGGADTIAFAIPGAGVQTIQPTSPLPTIVEPLTINGYLQPGAAANTSASGDNAVILIVVNGFNCPLPMGQQGISAFTIANTAPGSVIKGLAINGWTGSAIIINANGCLVSGNFIGTNAAGTTGGVPNCVSGGGSSYGYGAVLIMPAPMANNAHANNNTVGGVSPGDRNVISGNYCSAVQITDGYPPLGTTGVQASGNVVLGNHIGTVASGSGTASNNYGSLPNNGVGISAVRTDNTVIGGTAGVTVGGPCTGSCNVITSYGGINIGGVSTGSINILGNFIGIDANGVNALPPAAGQTQNGDGIYVSGGSSSPLTASVFIGGTTPQTRNVISGWTGGGVNVQNGSTTCPPTCPATVNPGSVYIYGNYIGTNAAGNAAVPNGYYGVTSVNNTNLAIGGTAAGMGNVISGMGRAGAWGEGIHFEGTFGSLIQGNYIGVGADGFTPVPNYHNGIAFFSSGFASNDGNTIGSTTLGGPGGNIIANNGVGDQSHAAGIGLLVGVHNKIWGNSIYNNASQVTPNPQLMINPTSVNIDLQTDGITANDSCDGDTGANNFQNFPVVSSASSDLGSTTITGAINSTASSTFTLQFFASPTNGLGDTQRYLGSSSVATSAGCTGSYTVTVPAHSYPGEYITATATSSTGDTSEVSTASAVVSVAGSPAADFDFSGTADLVLRNRINGDIGMWLVNGATVVGGAFVGSPGGTYTVAGVGDFNGDGKADILLRDSLGNIGMWLMNGSAIASGAFVGAPGGSYTVAAVADFNGDGKADILLRDGIGNLGLWFMNGSTIASGAYVGSPGGYTVVAARDFNGDGKADILLRDSLGTVGLWIMNGSVIVSGALVGSPGAYRVVGVADFNGDQRADILLQDATGTVGMWLMNGATISSGAAVGSTAGNAVAATGDFNGDGRADIILRNPSTGDLGVWLMNGPTIAFGGFVGSPGAVYQIH